MTLGCSIIYTQGELIFVDFVTVSGEPDKRIYFDLSTQQVYQTSLRLRFRAHKIELHYHYREVTKENLKNINNNSWYFLQLKFLGLRSRRYVKR